MAGQHNTFHTQSHTYGQFSHAYSELWKEAREPGKNCGGVHHTDIQVPHRKTPGQGLNSTLLQWDNRPNYCISVTLERFGVKKKGILGLKVHLNCKCKKRRDIWNTRKIVQEKCQKPFSTLSNCQDWSGYHILVLSSPSLIHNSFAAKLSVEMSSADGSDKSRHCRFGSAWLCNISADARRPCWVSPRNLQQLHNSMYILCMYVCI